ncbi:DMT family transporter [Actinoplanes subtropicus]|uniref:DMT family transporter n=1 Tax=Actinoplanes subtropicus TaxID=543632 RepID=UPI00068B3674|nr:DMT family transporter [Actinoplanes subtropicus]
MAGLTRLRGRPAALGVLAAVAAGILAAVQARVNSGLAGQLRDGLAAALVSNGSALLLVSMLLFRAGVRAGLRRAVRLRPWELAGGACGALYVTAQGVSVAGLGLAVFTVAVVTGQSAGALLVDRAGLAPGGRLPLTRARLIGAALAVVAVAVAAAGRPRAGVPVALVLLAVLAGAGLAVQGAVNGRVRQAAGAVAPAVLVNAVVGTAGLVLAFGGDVAVRGRPAGVLPAPWWFLGGVIGLVVIAIGVGVVRHTGALLLGLGLIAGQVLGAVAIDAVAPGPGGRPGLPVFLGAGLALVAVATVLGSPPKTFRS